MFNLFNQFDLFRIGHGGNTYIPLINYDWSTTTTSGLRYLNDVGSTPTYNASMYFGRGAYLNGVDQTITVPINTTIQTALKRVNGVVTINETSQTLTNYVISGLGVHKDYYLFTRLLTTAEKDSYTNTPELFYAMAQADSTCVLNMPMCETSSTARNYKTGIDYAITNYTTSVRDNAKNLQYGLQTCKFVRDGLGVIQTASDYLECDGVGYADTGWVPSVDEDFTLELVFSKTKNELEAFGLRDSYMPNAKLYLYSPPYVLACYVADMIYQIKAKSDDTPYHIIVTQEISVGCKIYIDGILGNSTSSIIGQSNRTFYLGGRNTESSNISGYSKKPLKLCRVYNNKALTQEEVTTAYNDAVSKGLLS